MLYLGNSLIIDPFCKLIHKLFVSPMGPGVHFSVFYFVNTYCGCPFHSDGLSHTYRYSKSILYFKVFSQKDLKNMYFCPIVSSPIT